ncbi:hypothetical protein HDU93_009837, partial [Gonapodya sp. JEL0774]
MVASAHDMTLAEARKVILEDQVYPKKGRQARRLHKVAYISTVLFIVIVSSVYYYMHLSTVPISGHVRFLDITPENEQWLADVVYKQPLEENKDTFMSDWNLMTLMVHPVAKQLAPVSGLTNLDWKVHVVENAEPNAFVLPGGKIFVNTGLFKVVNTVDELAIVLGHELAHQGARHSCEKFSLGKFRILAAALSWSLGFHTLLTQNAVSQYCEENDLASIFMFYFTNCTALVIDLPYSREIEAEADYIGMHLASAACYDPSAAPVLWSRFHELVGDKEPIAYLSDHPSSAARIEAVNYWLPGALKRRKESDSYTAEMFATSALKRRHASSAMERSTPEMTLNEARKVILEDKKDRRSRWRAKVAYVSAAVLLISGAYYLMNLDVVPISGRVRFLDVTPEDELWLAEILYNQLLEDNKDTYLSEWNPMTLMVKSVAKRLVPVSGLTNLDWKVHVVENPEPNAFVLPGGKIFVNAGLFSVVKTVDELAVVLGHEIGHQVARHSSEKISLGKFRILAAGLSWAFGIEWLLIQLAASQY